MFPFSVNFKHILILTFPLRNAFSLAEKTIDGDQKQHYNLNQICLGFANFICYVLCHPGLCINKVNLGFQYLVNYECFSPHLFSSFVTLYTRCRELFLWFKSILWFYPWQLVYLNRLKIFHTKVFHKNLIIFD